MPPLLRPDLAVHAFRVIFPQSELRAVGPAEGDRQLTWYPAPPLGHAAYVELYVTPPIGGVPRINAPFDLIGTLPLAKSSHVVVFAHHLLIEPEDHLQLRELKRQALAARVDIRPTTRGWALAATREGLHSLVEFAPASDPAV